MTARHDEQAQGAPSGGTATGLGGGGLTVILRELNAMQRSEDLLERYRSFVRLVEDSLRQAVGPCSVSLWCPAEDGGELIECVIRAVGEGRERQPYRVPLDSPAIRGALRGGGSFLCVSENEGGLLAGREPEASLACDGCVVLERPYGQPVIVLIERPRRRPRPGSVEGFEGAVQLVRFFWEQLQAANQRQWLAEHDHASRALRGEVFVREAKRRADEWVRGDEPFAVVVLTVRGFRSMFARDARQWQRLSGLFGSCLEEALRGRGGSFLVGRMADDVFAVLLGGADAFLAEAMMGSLCGKLEQQMTRTGQWRTLDVEAVDVRWAVADYRAYGGWPEQWLNAVYRQLFSREGVQPRGRELLLRAGEVTEGQTCR